MPASKSPSTRSRSRSKKPALSADEQAALVADAQEVEVQTKETAAARRAAARSAVEAKRLAREAKQDARKAEMAEAHKIIQAESNEATAPWETAPTDPPVLQIFLENGEVITKTYNMQTDVAQALKIMGKVANNQVQTPMIEDDNGTLWVIGRFNYCRVQNVNASVIRLHAKAALPVIP